MFSKRFWILIAIYMVIMTILGTVFVHWFLGVLSANGVKGL